MKTIRTVFAGTPSFALPSLELLERRKDIELVGVYTQPDRPAGRGKEIKESAVKKASDSLGAKVFQPSSLHDQHELRKFCSLRPDLLVVAAYGLMIPKKILEIPKYSLNVHASLLPRWRGAAPIQRAIMNGDSKTGISIMRIVEKLDAGPVLNSNERPIRQNDTTETLTKKLALDGAIALDLSLSNIGNDSVIEIAQQEKKAVYANKISKEETFLEWSKTAENLHRQIRALSPNPGAIADIGQLRIKILNAEITNDQSEHYPGTVNFTEKNILKVATSTTDLRILSLQLPGKKIMATKDFLNGYRKIL